MQKWLLIRRLRKEQTGATAVEFAIVAGVLFFLMLGIIEYGLIMFSKVIIESVTQEAGRSGGIGEVVPGCGDRVCSVKKLVADKTFGLIDEQSVYVTAAVVSAATAGPPPIPDICLDNVNVPYPAVCTGAYQDNNNNGKYDPPVPLTNLSIGQPGQIVEIRVTYLWRIIFPFFRKYFGQNGVLTITSTTVVKNEPF